MKVIRKRKRKKINLSICIIVLAVFFLGFFIGKNNIISVAKEKGKMETEYISIKLKSGDNLEKIEKEYNNTNLSKKDYINNVKKINKLNDDLIYAGTYLILENKIK